MTQFPPTSHTPMARRVQRALYLLVRGQVTQFSLNLPLACGSQGAEGPVSICPKTNDAVLPQPPTHLDLYFYGTHHLIPARTHAPAHPPTRAPAPALAPPTGAFARRHTHTGARPPCVLAPAVLPRSTPALALAPHANRSVVGDRAHSGPSCRPPGTGSLRPSPSTVPDPPTGSPRILGDPARVLSRLRPLARGQRWSGPRTYPGQVHCLDRPLADPCVRLCGVPSPPPRHNGKSVPSIKK